MSERHEINVLFVDDEIKNLESFKAAFRRDFTVLTALSAHDAENILESNKEIQVIVSDQRMPGKLGTQFLEETIKTRPYQTGILLSAFTDDQEVLEAEKRNFIYKTIEKPLNEQLLKGYILEGFRNYQKHSLSPLKK